MTAFGQARPYDFDDDIAGRYADVAGVAQPSSGLAANDPRALNRLITTSRVSAIVSIEAARDDDRMTDDTAVFGSPADRTIALQPRSASDYTIPESNSKPDPSQAYFVSTQEWDGYVTALTGEGFEGVIYPVGTSSEDLRADSVTVPWQMLDEGVKEKVSIGAIFRMAAGHMRIKRQVMHGVKIYFRLATDLAKQSDFDRKSFEALFAD